MNMLHAINPATEEVVGEYTLADVKEALSIAKNCERAFDKWKKLTLEERIEHVRKIANELKSKKEELARTAALEMGKPIKEGRREVDKCVFITEYFCEKACEFLKEEEIDIGAKKSYVRFEPIGTILGIMPWNFPYSQVVRSAIPTLLLGNTYLLKHSTYVPGCSKKLEEIFSASLPEHVFANVICRGTVASRLIKSRYIKGVAFTGSVSTGRKIARIAGANLKKVVLELGGSDPFVVLKDADIEKTVEGCVKSRFKNKGEACNAAKRIIVVKEIAQEFTERFVERVKSLNVGDPLDESTEIGPLANKEQLEKIEAQVSDALQRGAKVLAGGKRLERKGYFYEPTVLVNIKRGMCVWKEEVFGPVAPVVIARNERHAIKLANDTKFGLGASVWTRDTEKGERIAREIEAGMVYINKVVSSDARLPFGGVKQSGIGRELSRYGMLEFANIKSVVVKDVS